jgi:Uma2 family endonuclease
LESTGVGRFQTTEPHGTDAIDTLAAVRAVMLEVDPQLLAERARLGLDIRDEMWDGELHIVPQASGPHQRFGTDLAAVLLPLVRARGLEMSYETGFYRVENDYRVPDLMVYRADQASERGAEGAELVIEIRSPRDETMVKLPWYLAQSSREVLIIDRDTLDVELHDQAGRREPARSDVLGCTFTSLDGPALRVEWDGGETTVSHR